MTPYGSRSLAPVHAIGWFEGRFGYNTHTRNFFDRLSRHIPVVASPLVLHEGPSEEDRAVLRRMTCWQPKATIALLYGNMMSVLKEGLGKRVAYTVWESTKLPSDWLPPLREADEIWIPSEWGRDVLADNGLPIGPIKVVPEGVDPAIFNPDVTATDALARFKGFKFLNIGRFEERKGTAKLMRCFDRAFEPEDEVFLVLACDNAHDPDFNFGRILQEMNLRNRRKIVFIPPMRQQHMLAHLYTACDAFVSPFRAEGWGLPLIEAMACGLPVIATDYSGPTEFLGPDAYRLDYRMTDITEQYFSTADGTHGQWADADEDQLIEVMRHVYRHREEAARRGKLSSEHVIRNFSWDAAAKKAVDLLD